MARRSLGQRVTIFSWSSCEEAVGRSALISATQTPLCSPKALACLLSCMCANVWHVSGVLMRWIWLVASTDAMDAALGVAPAVRTCSCSHLAAVRTWQDPTCVPFSSSACSSRSFCFSASDHSPSRDAGVGTAPRCLGDPRGIIAI